MAAAYAGEYTLEVTSPTGHVIKQAFKVDFKGKFFSLLVSLTMLYNLTSLTYITEISLTYITETSNLTYNRNKHLERNTRCMPTD